MNLNKTIAWVTSALVLVVAIISFALSYHALQGVASVNGLNGWLSFIWPLLVDFSLVVFSLCVVSAHLYSETTWKQWVLVSISTGLTVFYNALYAYPEMILPLAQRLLIIGLPPVMLFFSFELLMSQLKSSVKRSQQQATLTAWDNALAIAQKGFDELAEQTAKALEEKDNLLAELTKALEIASDPVAHRRQMVYQARQGEHKTPYNVLAEEWHVSEQTIKNDMAHYPNGKQ